MESGWNGWLRSRCSLTRKQVSCEQDNDCGECGGGGGSGDKAGAGLLCSGESGGGGADGVRCSADGGVCAEYAAGTVGGPGVVLQLFAEERDKGGGIDDGRSRGGAEPGAEPGGGDGAARV